MAFPTVICAAADEHRPDNSRPDYADVAAALDGDSDAIAALIACADRSSDCRTIAAAALHRQGRTDEAIELLQHALALGQAQAGRIIAELAFEQQDLTLAWAAGSLWMEANDLELPDGEVEDRGMRVPWLMGQSAQRLGEDGLERARRLAEELRSRQAGERPPAPGPTAAHPRPPEAVSRTPPKFPRELARAGTGGWATIVFSVSTEGKVNAIRALFWSHRALADASIVAVRQWRFEPVEGRTRWTQLQMDFSLGEWPSTIPEEESGVADEQGWIRFENLRGWIEFTVRVNGVSARAMLDSGAQGNAISRRLAERAGIGLNYSDQVRVHGIYGQKAVPVSRRFDLGVGSATVPMEGAIVLPTSSPDLILGVGLFQVGVVQIDYPGQRLRFLDRDAVDFEGNVPMRTTGGTSPQVASEIAGRRVWMLLDTGNAGATLIKSRLVRRLELEKYLVGHVETVGIGAVGSGRSRVLQIPGFRLGPFPFETLMARYIEDGGDGFEGRRSGWGSRIRHDTARYDGILGSEVLKNFVITTDLKNRSIHFGLP